MLKKFQSWRVAEPIKQQPAISETWSNDQQEESPIRRRVGRKRKRRPPAETTDDNVQESKYPTNHETPTSGHDFDAQTQDTTEMPRRRRKKVNFRPNRWLDESLGSEVPLRRRLQRRKRPSLDTWPELSEFGGFVKDSETENSRERIKVDHEDRGIGDLVYKGLEGEEEYVDKEIKIQISRPKSTFPIDEDEIETPKYVAKEDKSLSEFSMEVMNPVEKKSEDIYTYSPYIDNKIKEKTVKVFYDIDKAKVCDYIDIFFMV
jgi:hypothetical protein